MDNGELVFDLHVTIEGLAFTNGIPTEGEHTISQDALHLWSIMGHIVIYQIKGNLLTIVSVAPLE